MQVTVYLSFNGDCEAAFNLYESRSAASRADLQLCRHAVYRRPSRRTGRTRSCTAASRSAVRC